MHDRRLDYLLQALRATKRVITYGDHGQFVAEISVLTQEEIDSVKKKILQLLDITTR